MEDTGGSKLIQNRTLSIGADSKVISLTPTFQDSVTWIQKNISKKECCFFSEKGASSSAQQKEDVCMCGYSKSEHVADAIWTEDRGDGTWDPHVHVREVPTDAFGEISFGGLRQTTTKYARVSTETSPEVLYQLMTEQWKVFPPNLLISVTGGAKNFYLKTRLKNIFQRGLIKVAQTTGAWIITGGTNTGVMKHVGQAVRDYSLSSSMQGQIVTIGMATWGVIHNKEVLVNSQGCFPAHYPMDVKGRLPRLDNNHTHFLLVDDGTYGRYGFETNLRSRLEKFISEKTLGNKAVGVNIPVVLVVLDGGAGTLNTIYTAMLNDTPCVVLEGSGRMADVIAHAAGLPVKQVTISLIDRLVKKFLSKEYDNFSDLTIIDWTKKIQDIIRMSHLLTVFRGGGDSHGDVDVAILQALFKASRVSASQVVDGWRRQLELAIVWNRVDIATTEIFTDESQWKSSDLHWAMFSALVGNKPRFVSLLLENGVCLREFLQSEDTLCGLYKQLPNCFFLRKLAKRVHTSCFRRRKVFAVRNRVHSSQTEGIALKHVSDEVRHLLGNFTQPIYPPPTTMYHFNMEDGTSLSRSLSGSQAPLRVDLAEAQRDPARDLFLWAVVQKNKELSEITWEQCTDCVSAALAGCKILRKMAEEESDADEAANMQELADHFEMHAIGVFTKCYSESEERAKRLLVRVSPFWGKTTCLRLALEANCKSFVALSGVQALLTEIWCGELSVDNPVWRVTICMIFFPLIYTGFLTYRPDDLIQKQNKKCEDIKTVASVTGSVHRTKTKSPDPTTMKSLNCWSRLTCLYSSPQVKFYWNIVSYFAFLFLFAIVLMMDFQTTPSPAEILLYVWLFSVVTEEVRQFIYDPDGFGFHKKARMYFRELWNILDVLSIILFIIGLVFRLTTKLFYAGKVVLCLDFVVFCLRLMAIFSISRTLGPKIIIVRRMMMDMFFFMFLLSIWVVAYGVAKQGILIHNDNRLQWILRGAVYEPYLILFGNVPTNVDYSEFHLDSCSMNGSDPLKPKCPVLNENQTPAFPEWLTIIMLCVYLLFANILLLNLLIAIFNFTFQEVQDNTDRIWKFQRYELIKEYHSRPAAPPPFIILSHLSIFIRNVVLCRPPLKSRKFRTELPHIEEEKLLSWEALMKDRYLLSTQQQQSQTMERCTSAIPKSIHLDSTVMHMVNAITDRLEREEEISSAILIKRLARLEEQVVHSVKGLQWIMESLESKGLAGKEEQPLPVPSTVEESSETSDSETSDCVNETYDFHVKARQFHYPNSEVTRFPVPEEKVPWEVSFSSYEPSYFSSEDNTDGSDAEVLENFRNPGGRTGIRGQGSLNHLGANLHVDLVITRLRDSGRSVLEFLAVEDKQKKMVLPWGLLESPRDLPSAVLRIMGNSSCEKLLEKAEIKLFDGYVDDVRNTDNAWVETTVYNIHLGSSEDSEEIVNMMREDNFWCSRGSLKWEEVSSKNGLCSDQSDSLMRVAKWRNRDS
ncbi:transient receptor potential cation channel subfamily M member 2 isoform X3 [Syngnathus typhle]|uniref:transient receptor potential cation channel subfamily M member 2 isoform X3 n=1 Tax=Syngnathus typhle TaxID=161592 RepID=UPI002A69B9FC|nr:transient receptor potential cation channel subfamily M member 2 isoform X3 [Syngnathus typhle]